MNGPPARASTVVRILDGDGMVLVHGEFTHLIRSNDARYVLNVLLAERDADAAASLLGSFFQESGRGRETLDWRQVTGSFVSHAALQSRLEPAVNLDVRPDTRFGIRVLSIRYGMTLSGMVLGVFGFGMLLQHRPHARSPCASQDAEGDGFRMLPCYVVLVVIFAGFDLLCTLFADSSGGLLELNPLGSSLLQTPLLLSGVKISATLTSASILYCLRPYRIAQVTSWWMCLVCVMVTWRWVMFHSLFLS